jgi:uncharacterized membrane protein YjjP (DUF1212 family)
MAVGWSGITAPEELLGAVGVALQRPDGFSEARATYGGMHVAVGGFLVAGAFTPALRRTALVVATAFFGGLVGGRALSLALDGTPNPFVLRLFLVEAAGALAALTAYVATGRD